MGRKRNRVVTVVPAVSSDHPHLIERLEGRLLLAAQAYSWSDANIGAGGFVDGVFFDQHNSGVMYARTDIGGLYKTTNGGNNWTPLLDWVGNGNGTSGAEMQVLGFAIDPENSNDIYALTGGGVLYSTDGGENSGVPGSSNWTLASGSTSTNGNGNDRAAGERIAVDPYDSNIVLEGSNTSNGLYESTNAGHSFSVVSTFSSAVTGLVSTIAFDPYGGTVGQPTQTILVGVASKVTGSNLYKTTTGAGGTWSVIGNSGPTKLYPMRAAFDSSNDGDAYVTYSNGSLPDASGTSGAVWRYNLSTSTWGNITPTSALVGSSASAFSGLGVDAENAGTIVVTTFDHYTNGDQILRTTNANAASPTWVSLFGGYSTRNTTSSPWTSTFTDGIGNWAATAAIDPFNSAHIVYGTGQGLWTTLTGASATTLVAANSWYFLDYGIDFTAVIGLNAAPTGVPLFSTVGDINGFAHSTLTSSPAGGAILPNGSIGNMYDVDFAGTNPSFDAAVGPTGSDGGGYSTNDGVSWTEFASEPSGASTAGGDTVAVTVNSTNTGMTIVWSPSSGTVFYSNNNGASWTASTGPSTTGGQVFADRVTPGDFYYYVSGQVWFSSNYGASFTEETTSAQSGGAIAVNPFKTGDLYISSGSGVYHSGNFGATWARVGSLTSSGSRIALGAPAPGQTVPAIYIFAGIGSFTGFYRSDDGGSSWVQINDLQHQWGGYITYNNGGAFGLMAADPTTYGRVYLVTNGRGVIVGNPASSLPVGWSDQDINTPGDAGWATSSTVLSSGSTVNQWTLNGGGAGIGGTSDQFNFAMENASGSGSVSAQLIGIANADGNAGTPLAGVMYRASNNANDPFAAMMQTATGSLMFETRTTSGGSVSSVTLGSVPVGSEYVEVVRNGSSFSGYYSSNAETWTQLGSTVAIAGIPTVADAGLAASAAYNTQLTAATFKNVNVNTTITVASAAAATPNPVTGSSTALSVLGADADGENLLSYTWSVTGPGSVTYSGNSNGANAAKNITAQFSVAGSYNFTVTITDGSGVTTNSSIAVTVNQTVMNIVVSPPSAAVISGTNTSFSAAAFDQFGNAMASVSFGWSITGTANGNSINSNGLVTPGSVGGTYTVTATVGSVQGSASILVVPIFYSDVAGDNNYAIDLNASNPLLLQIFVNTPETGTPTYTIAAAQVPSLTFQPGSGNDSLTVDFVNGNPVPSAGVSLTGGSGNDTLFIQGNAGSVASSQVSISGSSGMDTLTVNGGTYTFTGDPEASTSSLTVNDNSAVVFSAGSGVGINPLHLAGLNIGTNATASLATPGSESNRSLLITGGLTIAGTGLLNMGGNDMIVQGGTESTIYNNLQTGFNVGAGYWNGTSGIASTAAAGDTTYLTTLSERVSDGSSFDGVTPNVGDVLVKYTLYGDADLNGVLDGADYQQIDNGFGNHSLSGWSNGDFNYDGVVDGSDFSLIDNAFNQETAGAAPLALVGGQAELDAIPTAKVSGSVFATEAPIIAKPSAAVIENVWSALDDKDRKSEGPFLLR